MKKTNIIIVDDHKILRTGLRMLLEGEDEFEIKGEADNLSELIDLLERNRCDILLLDITLKEESGLEILDIVRERYPEIKVIVLTMHESSQYVRQALKSGAKGYVSKRSADKDLLNAIRTVLQGGVFLDPEIALRLSEDGDSQVRLSEREIQVLNLLVRGFTLKEIAYKLGISEKTVDTYKNRIFEKTGLNSKPELLQFAIKHGIFKPDE